MSSKLYKSSPTFEERYKAVLEQIKNQADLPVVLEGTDMFKEWIKLQEYDDPVEFIRPLTESQSLRDSLTTKI